MNDSRLDDRVFAGLLLAATLLLYFPAWNGPPVFDDETHITRPALRSVEGLRRIWSEPGVVPQYYPVFHTALWIEHKLWGDAMLGYHLVNIVLHAAVAFLAMMFLRRLAVPGAHLAAAVFALHPVHVETVAYVSEMKNTLSGAFCLSAAFVYLHFDETRRKVPFVLALILFVLGWMSKGVIATLPAALLVILWWKRGRLSPRKDVLPLLPLLIVGIAGGLFTAYVERKFVGAEGPGFDFTVVQRFLIAGRAVWFYLGKILWPARLMLIYPRWEIDARAWWPYVFPAGFMVLLGLFWALRRRSRGPLAAALLFAGTLLPVLGFLNVNPFRYSFVADHYVYLPSLAVIALAAAGAARWVGAKWPTMARGGLSLVLLCPLAWLTWRQCALFGDVEALYRNTIRLNPEGWMAYNNLGGILARSGRNAEAIQLLNESLRLRPDYAEAHTNLGVALENLGRHADAIASFDRALRIDPDQPVARYNLGTVLGKVGRPSEAIQNFAQAVRIRPDSADTHNNFGGALADSGQIDAAIEQFSEAVRLDPDHAAAHYNLALNLARRGDPVRSRAEYERVLKLRPDHRDARNNLAALLAAGGDLAGAKAQYEILLRYAPDHYRAEYSLGLVEAARGDLPAAEACLERALQLKPDFAEALKDLGAVLLREGRPAEAAGRYEAATRMRPDWPEAWSGLGDAYSERGDFTGATSAYDRALALLPDDVGLQLAAAAARARLANPGGTRDRRVRLP